MIPGWTDDGLLPQGVHPARWGEILERFGWNTRRLSLLFGLRDALRGFSRLPVARRCGSTEAFVTDKEAPGDYDACWEPRDVNPMLLDPLLLDFSRVGRTASKSRYQGDLLIAGVELDSGLPFVEFFQQTRDGHRKGIVLLDPQEHR